MKCSNCKGDIPYGENMCPYCGRLNNNNDIDYKSIEINPKVQNLIGKSIRIIAVGPILFAGIIFVCISIFADINQKNKSKEYIETTGILVDYIYEEEGYTGEYEYIVNGQPYRVSPKEIRNKEDFKKEQKVKYNPQRPGEAVIYVNWNDLLINGVIMIAFSLLAIFSKKVRIRR